MKLELEDGTVIDQPNDQEIETALATLDMEGNRFAILSQDPLTYIQTFGLMLEYQEGDTDHHYRAVGPVAQGQFGQIVSAFQKYAKGDPSWKDDFEWEQEHINSATATGIGWAIVVIGGLVLLAILVALCLNIRQPCAREPHNSVFKF